MSRELIKQSDKYDFSKLDNLVHYTYTTDVKNVSRNAHDSNESDIGFLPKWMRFIAFIYLGMYLQNNKIQLKRLKCWFGRHYMQYIKPINRSDCKRCGYQIKHD